MRFNHVIAVAFILVLVGAKLTFFAAPIAEADARSIAERERGCFPDPPSRRETSGAERPRHVVRLSVTSGVIDPARFSKCQLDIPERNARRSE